MNSSKICITCGTTYLVNNSPKVCAICLDDRQWVPEEGQIWTKSIDLLKTHSVKLNRQQEHLYEFAINPKFAIG